MRWWFKYQLLFISQKPPSEAKKQIGTSKKVLVLKNAAKGGQGLSHDYWPVDIMGAESFLEHWSGQEVDLVVTGYDHSNKQHMEGHLVAEVKVWSL